MRIYHWTNDLTGDTSYHTSRRDAERSLRLLLESGDTSTAVRSIQGADAVELLEAQQERVSVLATKVRKLECELENCQDTVAHLEALLKARR